MTSDEIKKSGNRPDNDWLKEIALQLAILNERESIQRQVAAREDSYAPALTLFHDAPSRPSTTGRDRFHDPVL
jgi:hypothetical protein